MGVQLRMSDVPGKVFKFEEHWRALDYAKEKLVELGAMEEGDRLVGFWGEENNAPCVFMLFTPKGRPKWSTALIQKDGVSYGKPVYEMR
jgi:hypothetical protein